MHTDANVCDCTWGYMDTVRESALKVDSGGKIPCRTGESNLGQRSAGPMLCQLSYIPIPSQDAAISTHRATHLPSPYLDVLGKKVKICKGDPK